MKKWLSDIFSLRSSSGYVFTTTVLSIPFLMPQITQAGILIEHPEFSIVTDAYINISAGLGDEQVTETAEAEGDIRFLALHENESGLEWGGRITFEASRFGDDRAEIGEASLLLQDDWGRIEWGKRQGLPDVLTGFAPNNYAFTSAQYGPPTGTNLNPAGGLQTAFLTPDESNGINRLSSLGFVATLSGNHSQKLIYAAPRTESGITSGLSYAPDIGNDNSAFRELIQGGLTYDYYWGNHTLHTGASYVHAKSDDSSGVSEVSDLNSVNAGISATFSSALTLGVSATYDGDSGQVSGETKRDRWGWVSSVNYNKGRWTYGGFYQQASGPASSVVSDESRLDAAQAGLSYRFNIRTRIYTAYYYYQIQHDADETTEGDVALVGLRLIL